ncbi:MAG: hypothetical protein QF898_08620 [SAR202 cluster bacterium]|nr:hypothetical protein [SAR202 cluster bacterium]MDP6512139.1 hypothetical protein [SAR202 cluster bacterium]
MSGRRIALLGLLQALGTCLYVALVVSLILIADSVLPDSEVDDHVFAQVLLGVAGLVFFIVSACISGSLVLGYPVVLALNQRIREAFILVAVTVAWLVMVLVGVGVVIALVNY